MTVCHSLVAEMRDGRRCLVRWFLRQLVKTGCAMAVAHLTSTHKNFQTGYSLLSTAALKISAKSSNQTFANSKEYHAFLHREPFVSQPGQTPSFQRSTRYNQHFAGGRRDSKGVLKMPHKQQMTSCSAEPFLQYFSLTQISENSHH